MSYKLIISYDGTRYFGWQKVINHPTIQGQIEEACRIVLQEEVLVESASRTDRGVHARGQVVQIICTKKMAPEKLVRALNAHLPADIRVLAAEETDLEFHVSLDAISKTYVYHIDLGAGCDPFFRTFAWHYPYKLDLGKMQGSVLEMVGKRDFSAFTTSKGGDGMRCLSQVDLEMIEPHILRIEMTGDRFLYKMARTIAGTLAGIGSGKVDPKALALAFGVGKRALAGVTAPAHGLILQRISYS